MQATPIELYSADGDSIIMPASLGICPTCQGKGVQALHGAAFTHEQFSEWHDDERDAYFRGDYDTKCETCNGTGRVSVPDRSQWTDAELQQYDNQQSEASNCESRVGA